MESFHMNLAETVSFITQGGAFTQHKSLKLTKSGGIIDPSNAKNPGQALIKAKPCPLLNVLYKLGAGSIRRKDPVSPIVIKTNIEIQSDTDSDEKFNQKYSVDMLVTLTRGVSSKLDQAKWPSLRKS
eukprot:116006_1